MQVRSLVLISVFLGSSLAGCLGSDNDDVGTDAFIDSPAPALSYLPDEPDASLVLEQLDLFVKTIGGVEIHSRVIKPEGDGPFPVIVEFTPYNGEGDNTMLNNVAEPYLGASGTFVGQFVRRGYAFAFADVRGTSNSSGCLDLRGEGDIDDVHSLIEQLGTEPWSNGNVGFIGASYPGSEAHMAALGAAKHENSHLKAVIPIVASTSFYHYHHNDGVPYSGQHSLGGTNTGYTSNAVMPTISPQASNWGTKHADDPTCPTLEQVLKHGGMDQSGAYYDWWQERNLRERAQDVQVPVLMAQGLADWNVKPDHIATWYNDLPVQKTLIAGQWGHAYPRSASDDCDTFTDGQPSSSQTFGLIVTPGTALCDPDVPYDQWWPYATAFFDTHLKGIDTGMFETDVAWVQANDGSWHRSANWPLLADDREELVLHLTADGKLASEAPAEAGKTSWDFCGRDQINMGQGALASAESQTNPCSKDGMNTDLVFESEPMTQRTIVSGVPLLDLVLKTTLAAELGDADAMTHLTAVIDIIGADGKVVDKNVSYQDGGRQNYGYLNPLLRDGLLSPQPLVDGDTYSATIDFYPQEDVLEVGDRVRVTISSIDNGRSIEDFGQGTNTILLDPANDNRLVLPLRPLELQGVRLPEPPMGQSVAVESPPKADD